MLRNLFLKVIRSPPGSMPPPLAQERDSDTRCTYTSLLGVGKRLNLVTWRPNFGKQETTHVDLLVLGDSYADDIDMGFECWPTLLARKERWSCLSCARGGAEAAAATAQYALASDFAVEANLLIDEETVVLVHLGGNDLLHGLRYGPIACLLLLCDVAMSLFSYFRLFGVPTPLPRLPRVSFFGIASRRVTRQLRLLLSVLSERGHHTVVVSGLPVCSVVPTVRVIVSLLTGSWLWQYALPGAGAAAARVVTLLADGTAALLQSELFGGLASAAAEVSAHSKSSAASVTCSSPRLVLLDEAAVLREIASQAGEGGRSMWKDFHHPTAECHQKMSDRLQKRLHHQLGMTACARSSARSSAEVASSSLPSSASRSSTTRRGRARSKSPNRRG